MTGPGYAGPFHLSKVSLTDARIIPPISKLGLSRMH